ncbi:MAG: IS110 family transposase [Burkholderiales bacterium]|nr:IS110 family transposase [Burkholderiales bacterium]MDE2078626.1 IS110 family transposase [Burkholderiales bacterium]
MEYGVTQQDKPKRRGPRLEVTNPNAAGIDIGSASHYVAVPADRDDEPVREFKSFTVDVHKLADWLDACGVDTVAMESTGVYWIPVYEILERRGFTVLLVNARHVKNVAGRKSDVLDCQWLQQLHSYGLLRGAFRPADQVCVLRSLSRQRAMLLRLQARHIQHMQKALVQMNIQLANVISDVVGETGQKILRAIVAGERDPYALAGMKNVRIKASEEEIAQSLRGNWRAEHVFALKQALELFDFYAERVADCDALIEQQMIELHQSDRLPGKARKKSNRNNPKFDVRTRLYQMCGVDLTRIDGIDVCTAMTVLSEVGVDMSKFPTVKHFAAWLGLCPGTKISGGKVLGSKTQKCANKTAQALRQAASCLKNSQSALGAYYRRMCAKMDKPKAITAAAHKLARLIYSMITKGEEYVDQGQAYYEERYRQRVEINLRRKAEMLGLRLVPMEAV